MQEEVEQRTVTLAINTTKMSANVLKSAIAKYLAYRKEKVSSIQIALTGQISAASMQSCWFLSTYSSLTCAFVSTVKTSEFIASHAPHAVQEFIIDTYITYSFRWFVLILAKVSFKLIADIVNLFEDFYLNRC